jgi:hypothetical protein
MGFSEMHDFSRTMIAGKVSRKELGVIHRKRVVIQPADSWWIK